MTSKFFWRRMLKVVLVLVLVLAALAGGCSASGPTRYQQSWAAIPAPPAEADQTVVAWDGVELLDVGADQHGRVLGIGGSAYDPLTRRWRVLPFESFDGEGSSLMVGAWTGKELAVVEMGYPHTGVPNRAVALQPSENRWVSLPDPPQQLYPSDGVSVPEAFSVNGDLLLVGSGQDSVSVLVPGGRSWTTYSGPSMPQMNTVAFLMDDEIVVEPFGEEGGSVGSFVFSLENHRWRKVDGPSISFFRADAFWTGTDLDVVQRACGQSPQMAQFDPRSGQWSYRKIDPSPVSCQSGYASAWTGKELVIYGQSDLHDHLVGPPGAAFNPATGRWRPLDGGPLLADVSATVWTGSQVLFVGGGRSEFVPGIAYTPPNPIPVATPAPSTAPRLGLPVCAASNLVATTDGFVPLSGSTEGGAVYITSTASAPCALSGQGEVHLFDSAGRAIVATNQPTDFFPDVYAERGQPVVLMKKSNLAAEIYVQSEFQKSSSADCANPPTASISVALPHDETALNVGLEPGTRARQIASLGMCGSLSISAIGPSDTAG